MSTSRRLGALGIERRNAMTEYMEFLVLTVAVVAIVAWVKFVKRRVEK